MEISTKKWNLEDADKYAREYLLLAKEIMRYAAEHELDATQVDAAFEKCKSFYKRAANRLLVTIDEVENVFDFDV